MSGILALASAIAAFDRSGLERLLRARDPLPLTQLTDPIGLATALLRPESIRRALADLDTDSLALLATERVRSNPERAAALTALGLIGHDDDRAPRALPEVTEAVRVALADAGINVDLGAETHARPRPAGDAADAPDDAAEASDGTPGPPEQTHAHGDTSGWFAPALQAVAYAAESLRVLATHPARVNRNGRVAVAAIRDLGETAGAAPEAAERTVRLLEGSGLVAPHATPRQLHPTASAGEWLGADPADRWYVLAAGLFERLPLPLRSSLLVSADPADLHAALASLPSRYPLLDASTTDEVALWAADADHLGASVAGRLSDPALGLLEGRDREVLIPDIADAFPPLAHGVYLQPDLSIIIPGPLSPSDERIVSALSRPEQVGAASTRRVTEASLRDALAAHLDAPTVRSELERLSLTGIPQPLDYLLDSLAGSQNTLIIEEHTGDDGRTKLTISDGSLARSLTVDRRLQHLRLHPHIDADADAERASETDPEDAADDADAADAETEPRTYVTRLRTDHVASALHDAGYRFSVRRAEPADSPAPLILDSSPSTEASMDDSDTDSDTDTDTHAKTNANTVTSTDAGQRAAAVERILSSAAESDGASGITRLIELAIRQKRQVRLVAESRGQRRSFTLAPVTITGGRLRGSDADAGVERTIPLTAVTAVDLLDD